jgi:adenylate cyclase
VEIEFWDSIKNSVSASEYEACLQQYPGGSFAALARVRLEAISKDGVRDPQDREVEMAFWESVRESDNPALIQAYLGKYPNGEFLAVAEIRLGELRLKENETS